MNGLGNDFVVFDARDAALPQVLPLEAWVRRVADRYTGVGCDQVVVLSADEQADVRMTIYNADGSLSGACGNATRCVADREMVRLGRSHVHVAAADRVLSAQRGDDSGRIDVNMGPPCFDWQRVPLSHAVADTAQLPLHVKLADGRSLAHPVGVSMGNPHAVFVLEDDPYSYPLDAFAPALECDPLFPERANIGFVQVLTPQHLRLRVWERGAGLTKACGTGACAALVACVVRGVSERRAVVCMPGGDLVIAWPEKGLGEGHVFMSGPVTYEFTGSVDPEGTWVRDVC
jgi:diaminopimelate epimerase